MRALLTPAQRAGTEILAVSVDDREKIQLMLDRVATEYEGPPPHYTFLSDPGHVVIDRYGLRNEKDPRVPHPTVYVIDRRGIVRWKFTEVNYKIRPTNAMILEALNRVK